MVLKIAVLDPMPRARVRKATVVKIGDFWSWRRAKRQSVKNEWKQSSIRISRSIG